MWKRSGILRPQTVVFDQREEVLPSLVDGHVLLNIAELVEAERQVVKELVDVRLVGFVVGVAVEEGVRLNDDQTGVLRPHDLLDGGFDALGGDGFRREQVAGEAVLLIGSARHEAGVDIARADEHRVDRVALLLIEALDAQAVVVDVAQDVLLQQQAGNHDGQEKAGSFDGACNILFEIS